MEETRVNKYKEYRRTLLKGDTEILKASAPVTPEKSNKQVFDTTSTLPIDQVMDKIEQNDEQVAFLKKAKQKKMLTIFLYVFLAVVACSALAVILVLILLK